VHFPGLESGLIESNSEGGIVGVRFKRFLVIVEGGVVVLEALGLFAQAILAVTLRTAGGAESETYTEDEPSALSQHTLSKA